MSKANLADLEASARDAWMGLGAERVTVELLGLPSMWLVKVYLGAGWRPFCHITKAGALRLALEAAGQGGEG